MRLSKDILLAGRYEIIELVGSGGMALVYKARDIKLGRTVAIKTLREEYIADNEFLKRFYSEARAAASLSNSNIVNAYDVGSDGDVHFIVMEYVDGVTLKELILKRAPFENEETLSVAIQIADALSHAHKSGIIHRDIKPQNIIVTKEGDVKVTDFGIARSADAQTTTSSGAMGSVHYFSPEQARGRFVDFRSDIYALGIVMFEMATGELPFEGDTAVAVALKHISEPLPDAREINPEVSASVHKIVRKAAAKALTQRYESADTLLKDLKRAMTDDSGSFVKEGIELIAARKTETQEFEEIDAFDDDEYEDEDYDDFDDDEEYEDDYDDYEDNLAAGLITGFDKKTERKIIIAAVSTGIAIIILVMSIGFWLHGRRVGADDEPAEIALTMPSLSGMEIDDAKELLDYMELVVGSVDEVYSDDVPEGIVIEYYPGEGVEIAPGDEVSIVVSRGTSLILVPDAMGMLLADALLMREFAENIFFYEETAVFDDDLPIGVVVSQDPQPGDLAPRGHTITFEVSLGREIRNVLVPMLLGETEEVAKRRLEDAGLRIGNITAVYHPDFPAGQVALQTIAGGVEVTEGTVVTFAVSLGPRPEQYPPEPEPDDDPYEPPIVEDPPGVPEITETIFVTAPMDALGIGPVRVHVNKVTEGVVERLFDQSGLLMGNFPIPVTVSGYPPFEVRVYVNNQFESSQYFD